MKPLSPVQNLFAEQLGKTYDVKRQLQGYTFLYCVHDLLSIWKKI